MCDFAFNVFLASIPAILMGFGAGILWRDKHPSKPRTNWRKEINCPFCKGRCHVELSKRPDHTCPHCGNAFIVESRTITQFRTVASDD